MGDFGGTLKSGLGIGARVTTPIGPVRLDVGYPVTHVEKSEQKIRFHFNISRSF